MGNPLTDLEPLPGTAEVDPGDAFSDELTQNETNVQISRRPKTRGAKRKYPYAEPPDSDDREFWGTQTEDEQEQQRTPVVQVTLEPPVVSTTDSDETSTIEPQVSQSEDLGLADGELIGERALAEVQSRGNEIVIVPRQQDNVSENLNREERIVNQEEPVVEENLNMAGPSTVPAPLPDGGPCDEEPDQQPERDIIPPQYQPQRQQHHGDPSPSMRRNSGEPQTEIEMETPMTSETVPKPRRSSRLGRGNRMAGILRRMKGKATDSDDSKASKANVRLKKLQKKNRTETKRLQSNPVPENSVLPEGSCSGTTEPANEQSPGVEIQEIENLPPRFSEGGVTDEVDPSLPAFQRGESPSIVTTPDEQISPTDQFVTPEDSVEQEANPGDPLFRGGRGVACDDQWPDSDETAQFERDAAMIEELMAECAAADLIIESISSGIEDSSDLTCNHVSVQGQTQEVPVSRETGDENAEKDASRTNDRPGRPIYGS
jgi:hypothetical protein